MMDETVVQIRSSWKICEKNSLGTDFDSLANVQVMVNASNDVVEPGTFLDVVDMDHYLFFKSPEKNEERCVITITSMKGTLSSISLVTDARNIEIFIADSGQVSSYWKTFKGRVIDELSELGSETYIHEICFDCMVKHVELKLGKASDTSLYLFGLKVLVTPGKESNQKILPFTQNSIDFKNVEMILSNSNVPLSAGADRALQFMKHSGGAFAQKSQASAPNMEMIMNLINQSTLNQTVPQLKTSETKSNESASTSSIHEKSSDTSSATEIPLLKSYLDVRLKEMQEMIINDFDQKLKALEERQNQKFNKILQLLKK